MGHAKFTVKEMLSATQGQIISGLQRFTDTYAFSLSTDSRTVGSDSFFIPLSGEKFDGHDYLKQGFKSGATGAFVSLKKLVDHPEWRTLPNIIGVEDPLLAYLALAQYHRNRVNPVVVAVTGSSGKTTTKEMLFLALSQSFKTQKTAKNFNNEIGVSQTLLALEPETEVLIVEMGMRGLNQIELLSKTAQPNIALITNVGPAHIGLLGSLENIALAKCEIFSGLTALNQNSKPSIGIVNGDDPLLLETAKKTTFPGKLMTYSINNTENLVLGANDVRFTYQNEPIHLHVPGRHMVSNALGILTVCEVLQAPISKSIQGLELMGSSKTQEAQPQEIGTAPSGRWQKTCLNPSTNTWVINDAYNANPASMKASLETLLLTPDPSLKLWLFLGAMNELGAFSEGYHHTLGQWLSIQSGISQLFLVGPDTQWIETGLCETSLTPPPPVHRFDTVDLMLDYLLKGLASHQLSVESTLLFLKGSRGFALEKITESLEAFLKSEKRTLETTP
ncbi:MAG: UDP-N-acetylmuramoyl-tripeptide--D-alanyl-D-alanine ligase [Cyanobacteria bacterium]|nr:UDP-N-acetylmuramoyl-tripeptide--D-alanyl-D-alanine ligase [Cyanobacteriota bacterium]